jgi:hypothetical protein
MEHDRSVPRTVEDDERTPVDPAHHDLEWQADVRIDTTLGPAPIRLAGCGRRRGQEHACEYERDERRLHGTVFLAR